MTPDVAQDRLSELRKEIQRANKQAQTPKRRPKPATAPLTWKTVGLGLLRVATVVALPFLIYVRSSVFFYSQTGGAWFPVVLALTLTLGIVALYATWLAHSVLGKARYAMIARWVAAPMAAGWLLYSLLFLAQVNAKTDDVRAYYSTLHPVLRVAVSTAIIVDPALVITDMQRTAADYPRMGLPVNDRTRHYRQSDGWVHAVDLRTTGRGWIRNRGLQLYFWAMGFSTLRHVGTADHLHVQLRTKS